MTLTKLAALANVSVSVVSKAFSGREDVSDAMRDHVFAVARANGCFDQFYHIPYDKPVVAVIIPEVISQYYIHYMETLKRSLEASGYTMLLSISNFDEQMKEELVRYYTVHSKVDALILFGCCPLELASPNGPVLIEIGPSEPPAVGCRITLQKQDGLETALRCLYARGHRRIAYVGEAFTTRQEGMMQTILTQLGLETPAAWSICSRYRFAEAGVDGVNRLWRLPESQRPTAIVGAYGYITQGILSALAARGVAVPEAVSVVSMDSDPTPLHPTREVSCILSGVEETCAAAMEVLRQRRRAERAAAHCNAGGVSSRGDDRRGGF